ncbi:MAG: uncharacterized protein KVP18_002057 [Porospora cf. gigantea A]|uniref:uncharacterized protein n=1 Tax=Porospora cf. gigantea A TaxID=2853593 RepID=UPI00355ACBDB|nr:MAG: hypothetical protein KVP18_002057 [Porospora cf. gigantea A]
MIGFVLLTLALSVPIQYLDPFTKCYANQIHPATLNGIFEIDRRPVSEVQDVWHLFWWIHTNRCRNNDYWCVQRGQCQEIDRLFSGVRRDGNEFVFACLLYQDPFIESGIGNRPPDPPDASCGSGCPTYIPLYYEIARYQGFGCDGPDWLTTHVESVEERLLGNTSEACAYAVTTREAGFRSSCLREFFPKADGISVDLATDLQPECYDGVHDRGTAPQLAFSQNIFPAVLYFHSLGQAACGTPPDDPVYLLRMQADGIHFGCLLPNSFPSTSCSGQCSVNSEYSHPGLKNYGCNGSGWTGIRRSALSPFCCKANNYYHEYHNNHHNNLNHANNYDKYHNNHHNNLNHANNYSQHNNHHNHHNRYHYNRHNDHYSLHNNHSHNYTYNHNLNHANHYYDKYHN